MIVSAFNVRLAVSIPDKTKMIPIFRTIEGLLKTTSNENYDGADEFVPVILGDLCEIEWIGCEIIEHAGEEVYVHLLRIIHEYIKIRSDGKSKTKAIKVYHTYATEGSICFEQGVYDDCVVSEVIQGMFSVDTLPYKEGDDVDGITPDLLPN